MKYDKLFADFMGLHVTETNGVWNYAEYDGLESVKYADSWDWLLQVWSKASNSIIGQNKLKSYIIMAIADVNIGNVYEYLGQLISSTVAGQLSISHQQKEG